MIKIEHLVKYYGQNCAVDDISFEVAKGEIVGLLGPNGAGKSTTMNILTGYLSSTSGKAEIDGIDILSDPLEAKKLIGYLPEQPPLYPDMTVWEYLSFVYDLKCCRENRKEHINEVCSVVKIGDMQNRLIRSLSKGYRQRVGIAQALIGDPRVIIFDEPTVGLDPKQIIEIRSLIRSLGKNHTVILSTHILQEVQAVCDRIVIINKGRIVADEKTGNLGANVRRELRLTAKICGPQREVLAMLRERPGVLRADVTGERDQDAYTYRIETDSASDIRKSLFYALAEKGWALIGLDSAGLSLEDVFLSVVDRSEGENLPTAGDGRAERRTEYRRGGSRGTSQAPERAVAEELVRAAEKKRESDSRDSYRDEL